MNTQTQISIWYFPAALLAVLRLREQETLGEEELKIMAGCVTRQA